GASRREGPLPELFRATEAAQRQGEAEPEAAAPPTTEPEERTVEHVPSWEEASAPVPSPPTPSPDPVPPPPMPDPAPPVPTPEPRPDPLPPEPPPQLRAPAPPPPPAARYTEPLPESPARLHRVPLSDTGSYLAVIKVVGVGGA